MNWCSKVPTGYPSIVKKLGISIIGAGRIGQALGRRLREKGWKIHAVVTRSGATARRAIRSIGGASGYSELSCSVFAAPVILITVPESSIESVVVCLFSCGQADLRGKIVLHTSGALSSDVLTPLRSRGAHVGSMHPLQSFSGIGGPALDGRVFVIEGDRGVVRRARTMTRALGGQPVQPRAAAKPLYHAAAVLSAGHMLALEETAVQIFVSVGMKRGQALKALLPPTRQVLDNLEHVGPRSAWTGPLARGDYGVIATHETALQSAPVEYLDAYHTVNRLTARVLACDPQAALSELAKVSSQIRSQSKLRGTSA
jgi:predicted short-subunit dehydrogenase-like oxidoreductase (DUF2520 family)